MIQVLRSWGHPELKFEPTKELPTGILSISHCQQNILKDFSEKTEGKVRGRERKGAREGISILFGLCIVSSRVEILWISVIFPYHSKFNDSGM